MFKFKATAEDNIIARTRMPGSATQLAIFRILLGVQIFYSSSSELFNMLRVVEGTTKARTIFPEFIDGFAESLAVPYLRGVVQILSIFLMLGLFTRFILPFLFVGFLLLFSFWYSRFNAPVPWLYVWFPLLMLCFARCSDVLSLDSVLKISQPVDRETRNSNTYRWPVEFISGWFVYIYFAAGLSKVVAMMNEGFGWLGGGTSQKIIYDRFLDSLYFYLFGKPLFDYSSHSWVFAVLSTNALCIELVTVLIIFTSRYNLFILALVVSMHFFLYLTGVPGFMQLALILGVTLIPVRWFRRYDDKLFNR